MVMYCRIGKAALDKTAHSTDWKSKDFLIGSFM